MAIEGRREKGAPRKESSTAHSYSRKIEKRAKEEVEVAKAERRRERLFR
jgi:hypothetical protein